jgi:hypothetical protein
VHIATVQKAGTARETAPTGETYVVYVDGDIRDPASILQSPEV